MLGLAPVGLKQPWRHKFHREKYRQEIIRNAEVSCNVLLPAVRGWLLLSVYPAHHMDFVLSRAEAKFAHSGECSGEIYSL